MIRHCGKASKGFTVIVMVNIDGGFSGDETMRRMSFSVAILLATLSMSAYAQPPGSDRPYGSEPRIASYVQAAGSEPVPTITQVGDGIATAAPDEGYLVGGVVTTLPTASAALADNAAAMSKVLAAIKSSGVANDKIATVAFSISDHYKRVRSTDGQNQEQVKDGYTVSNKVKVTVSDLAKFGDVIDAMVASGVNEIDAIRFGNSKSSQIADKARTDAVNDATRKATLIARQLGYSLGEVVSTHEITYSSRYNEASSARGMRLDAAMAATPISAGSQDFRVAVTVTWKLVIAPLRGKN